MASAMPKSATRGRSSSKTIDALMKLELPSGVEVEIKV
jgi:ribosomal protein S10